MGNQENQGPGFGVQTRKITTGYHKHVNSFVYIIPSSQQRGVGGRLDRIEEGSLAVLNPHQGMKYDSERDVYLKSLINDDLTVDLSPGTIIEPATQEGLEASCRNWNIQEGVQKKIHKP